MFHSSSSFGGFGLFSYPDLNPNSTPRRRQQQQQQQQLFPPFSPPFPFLDNELFLDHFISPSQSLLLPTHTPYVAVSVPDKHTTTKPICAMNINNDVELAGKETLGGKGNESSGNNGNGTKKENPKRRGSKTDRHSKICTRQGPRDRRMRLSLKIARRFFDLQDFLGFDKASKTIDWLLNHSKAAIIEVAGKFDTSLDLGLAQNLTTSHQNKALQSSRDAATAAYNGTLEQDNVYGRRNNDQLLDNSSDASNKTSDELGFNLQLTAKDMRTQARARARERTWKKKLIRSLGTSKHDISSKTNPNRLSGQVVEDTRGTFGNKTSDQVMGKTSTSGSLAILDNSLEFTACSWGQQAGNIDPFEYYGFFHR